MSRCVHNHLPSSFPLSRVYPFFEIHPTASFPVRFSPVKQLSGVTNLTRPSGFCFPSANPRASTSSPASPPFSSNALICTLFKKWPDRKKNAIFRSCAHDFIPIPAIQLDGNMLTWRNDAIRLRIIITGVRLIIKILIFPGRFASAVCYCDKAD